MIEPLRFDLIVRVSGHTTFKSLKNLREAVGNGSGS